MKKKVLIECIPSHWDLAGNKKQESTILQARLQPLMTQLKDSFTGNLNIC